MGIQNLQGGYARDDHDRDGDRGLDDHGYVHLHGHDYVHVHDHGDHDHVCVHDHANFDHDHDAYVHHDYVNIMNDRDYDHDPHYVNGCMLYDHALHADDYLNLSLLNHSILIFYNEYIIYCVMDMPMMILIMSHMIMIVIVICMLNSSHK